jgi:hypothetical protein
MTFRSYFFKTLKILPQRSHYLGLGVPLLRRVGPLRARLRLGASHWLRHPPGTSRKNLTSKAKTLLHLACASPTY